MKRAMGLLVVIGASLFTTSAFAQPDAPAPQPAPAAATPAPAPAPAPAAAAPAQTDKPAGETTTVTIAKPDHNVELGARMGAVFGGEVTPKGMAKGETGASWIGMIDGDILVHPFFSVGAFGHFTNQPYTQEVSGRTVTEGDITTITLGVSAKGRIPLSEAVTARAGLYVGRNFLSASVGASGSSSKTQATGGGLDMGLTTELSYLVSKQVALTGQLGFFSQVSGSITPSGGKETDLAFTPKVFMTAGPSVYF